MIIAYLFIALSFPLLFIWLANVVIPRSGARSVSLANVGLGLCLVVAELALGSLLLAGETGPLLAARGVTLGLAVVLGLGLGLLAWGLRPGGGRTGRR
jgi:hypothetical protein